MHEVPMFRMWQEAIDLQSVEIEDLDVKIDSADSKHPKPSHHCKVIGFSGGSNALVSFTQDRCVSYQWVWDGYTFSNETNKLVGRPPCSREILNTV